MPSTDGARALGAIYSAQLRTRLAVQLQYRAAMFIWLISMILEPVIYLVVWSTVARAQGGEVGGLSASDFAAYYLVLMFVNHATFTWIMWEYEYYIKDGSLASLLLRPVHPIHRDAADNLAYKALTLTGLIPTALVLILAFQPAFDMVPWAVVAFIPALILAMLLRFAVEWTLAMAAFWTTRVSAINQLYFVVLLFFSGRLAPLTLFPEPVQQVAYLLPFRWMVYFPVELLLGRLTPDQLAVGLAMQVAWLAAAVIALNLAWRAGVKQFSAVGS